jgi:hypothetical protein
MHRPRFCAKTKNGSYLFIDRKEFWILKQWEGYGMGVPGNPLCEITLSFTTDNASISSTGDCRGFCGANMGVRGTQYKASKADVCDKSLL